MEDKMADKDIQQKSPFTRFFGDDKNPYWYKKDGDDIARELSEKERSTLLGDKQANRLRHFLTRTMSDRGDLANLRLKDARDAKLKRFGDSPFINTAPVGPGCNWLSVGPRNINGRIKSLAAHPTNNQILYAGAANGGVWKTTDGGQSWLPKMHDEASLAIGAVAVDPSTPDTVYAGTGEPVYLLSGGTPLPPGAQSLAWYYAGVGVYRSTNGGDSWTLTGAIENDFIYRIAVDPNDSNTLLCAGYSLTAGQGGLCRSTDAGTTWTTILSGIFTDVLFDPSNSGRAYAAEYNGGIHKSTDSGATWATRNTNLPATNQMGRISLSIAAANTDVLYAKIEADASGGYLGVYRTASAAEAPGGWSVVSNPGVDSGFLWWCNFIAADPSDATGNIVYAGGVDIARSGDGGSTWTLVADAYGGSVPPTHADQQDFVFDPTDSTKFFASNDGGIFHGSFTGGTPPVTWTKRSTGLVVTQFYDVDYSPASPTVFGGGAQDNGSIVSTGGLSWRSIFGGDGGYVGFHPTDPYTYYVQWQGGNNRRTTDGGATTVSASSGIGGGGIFPATVFAIDPGNPLILFSGTGRVYRTSNGGVGAGAWTAASGNIGSVTDIAIAPSSSAVIYAGTVNGSLYRATDGGVTATSFGDITPTVTGWPTRWLAGLAVHPTNSNIVYATFLGFNNSSGNTSDHVWRGVFDPMASTWTWTQISSGLPDVPVGAIVYHPTTDDLYIATDIGVFRSTDDGASWSPFEQGLPNVPVVDLSLDPTRNMMRAATHGRGMWQIDLSGTCPEVDIYLRDNIIDTGETLPSPSGVPDPTQVGVVVRHYKSADIKVDAPPFDPVDALVDGVEFDDPTHPYVYSGSGLPLEDIDGIEHNQPIRDQINRVYVQAHNRGWNKADSVTVKLIFADAGAGLPALPSDYWSNFPGDGFDQTIWKAIGTATLTDLLPGVPQVVQFDWTPPAGSSNHVCLCAMVDSPQDPLLPQTQLNVDNLTLGNKRITHRNTHPVNAPAPGGGPAWMAMNFNNAFGEARFFDFQLSDRTNPKRRIDLILPQLELQNGLEEALKGFRVQEISRDKLEVLVKRARRHNEISDYVVRKLMEMEKPILLEAEPGAEIARLSGVLIKPEAPVTGVFMMPATEKGEDPELRFDITQWHKDELVGGSEIHLRLSKKDAERRKGLTSDDTKCPRLRIKLDAIQILDDQDPWIKGAGEFVFLSQTRIDGDIVKGNLIRIPQTGKLDISDKPGRNIVKIDQVVFDGCVHDGEALSFSLCGEEQDTFTPDDPLTRFHRSFAGSPRSWVGRYGPDDEASDPEDLGEWRVWYRIEFAD